MYEIFCFFFILFLSRSEIIDSSKKLVYFFFLPLVLKNDRQLEKALKMFVLFSFLLYQKMILFFFLSSFQWRIKAIVKGRNRKNKKRKRKERKNDFENSRSQHFTYRYKIFHPRSDRK